MPTSPALAPLLARLDRLRARIRRILAVHGVARLVGWTAALLVLSFLADWLLDLPLGVRRFVRLGLLDRPEGLPFLGWLAALGAAVVGFVAAARRRSGIAGVFAFAAAGVVGVLGWVLGRHLLSPLRIRLPDESLALEVEHRFHRLNDRVAAALDFDRELAAPSRGESPAMMAHVVEEAAREAQGIEIESVASGRKALRVAGAAGLVVAVFAVLLVAMPATASLWARRSLFLEDVSWPQATTLTAVVRDAEGRESEKDPATPYAAALGQSLSVLARVTGKVPNEVEIVDRVAADGASGRPLSHRMRPVSDKDGLFEYEFRDVRGDFTFTLRGGDDRDEKPSYTVVVRVPPKVTALRCDLSFPEYLALPPRRVEGGTLTVPAGTTVKVAFETDAAVSRAEAFLDEQPIPLARDGAAWRFQFEAQKTLRWKVRIVTADGRENDPAVDSYEVTVEPDTPPHSAWIYPRAPVEVTPKGRVPLFAQTVDDHGITSLRLEVSVPGVVEVARLPLLLRGTDAPNEANDRPYGSDSILSYVPLEIATLRDKGDQPLVAPTRIQARIVATDNKGQESGGPWTSIDVLRPDDIERGFASQRARVKGEIEAIRVELTGLRATTAAVSADGVGDPERQTLRDVQFKQGKVRADLDRTVRTVAGLFTAYVYDRLGSEASNEKLLSMMDRRHRASFSRATDLKGSMPKEPSTPLATADSDTDVFPWALYREVVTARRERTLFDTGVIDKMITVLEHAVESAAGLAPAAQEAASVAAKTADSADVAALVAADDRLLAALDRTLVAMADWQSLSELVLFLRHLIDEQETLNRGIKTLDSSSAR